MLCFNCELLGFMLNSWGPFVGITDRLFITIYLVMLKEIFTDGLFITFYFVMLVYLESF